MAHYDDIEKGCKWSFQRWNRSMTYFGPNDAIIQSFNRDFYESLVRESIQNSLDAVLEKGKRRKGKGDIPQGKRRGTGQPASQAA